jgi:tetratricopeptide (TPR) repeat protein
MSKKGSLIAAFLIFQCTFSIAQKVKYKDLIELLNAKQYEMAEPFLKRYLTTEIDNPSAYLYMGIIYQENSTKNDVLKQTEALLNNIDSAIYFFEKALPMLTEKEIKRHDENYQVYVRRDPRTAEFSIKLSDIQLDIETRVKALKEKKEKVKPLKSNFEQTQKLYEKSRELFKAMQDRFNTENEMLLRSDDALLAELNTLTLVFDSCQVAFKSYKTILPDLGKTGYNQQQTLLKIDDFKKDGTTPTDFMLSDVKVWDYSSWTKKTVETIQKEIVPMRERLVSYDVEINKLREKLKKDSVSVKNDLTKLVDKLLYSQLNKFDSNPIPAELFKMKIAELEYQSDLIANKHLRDSANVIVRMNSIQSEIASVRKLDSIASHLVARDFDKDATNYSHFIARAYGTTAVLKSLVKTTNDYAHRERSRKEVELTKAANALKWVIAPSDSIPLFMEVADTRASKPLVIVSDSFTIGLKYADSLAVGYLYNVTPSRISDVGATFPIDAPNFKKRSLPIIKGLGVHEANDVYIALIYSQNKVTEGFPATIARVDKATGLAWSINYKFELTPSELLYSASTDELTIKTTGTNGESKIVVIDKKGKKIH